MPEGVPDPGVWIMSGGKLSEKPRIETPRLRMVGEICEAYRQDQLDKADTTLKGEFNHINHLKRLLGDRTIFDSLTLEVMQGYATDRSKADNRFGGKVSGSTVKKELTTLMQIWDGARQRGFAKGPCPIKEQSGVLHLDRARRTFHKTNPATRSRRRQRPCKTLAYVCLVEKD